MPHRLWYQSILDRLRSGVAPGVPGFVENLRACPTPNPNLPYGPLLWRGLQAKPLIPDAESRIDLGDWLAPPADGQAPLPHIPIPDPPPADALILPEVESGEAENRETDQEFLERHLPDPRNNLVRNNVVRMVIPERGGSRPGVSRFPHHEVSRPEADPFEFEEMPSRAIPLRREDTDAPAEGRQPWEPPGLRRLRYTAGPPLRNSESPSDSADVIGSEEASPIEAEGLFGLVEPENEDLHAIAERGYYPYEFMPDLQPVDLHPSHSFPAVSFQTSPVKDFWWKRGGPAKAPRRVARANPSFLPKGFVGFQPITRSQPSFKTLTTRTGDYAMAETASRERTSGLTPDVIASTNLQFVQQAALRLTQKHWSDFQPPVDAVEVMDYPASIEWMSAMELRFPITGFDFHADPERVYRNGFKPANGDRPTIDLAALLAEPEPAPPQRKVSLEPIVWDELEEPLAGESNGIPALAAALELASLELYEPPATKEAPPEAVSEELEVAEEPAAAEEPEVVPPDICDFVKFPGPHLRAGVATDIQLSEPASTAGTRIHLPALSIHPLRSPMSLGPLPETSSKAEPPAVRTPATYNRQAAKPEVHGSGSATGETSAIEKTTSEQPGIEAEASNATTESLAGDRTSELPTPEQPALESAAAEETNGATAAPDIAAVPAAEPVRTPSEIRYQGKGRHKRRRDTVDEPVEEPTGLSEELEDALAQAAVSPHMESADAAVTEDQADPASIPGPAIEEKPSEPSKPSGKRSRIEKESATERRPEARFLEQAPIIESSTKSFLLNPEPAPASAGQTISIGLNPGSQVAEPTGMGTGAKIGIAVAVLAAAGAVAVWQFSGPTGTKTPQRPQQSALAKPGVETAGAILGEAGWSQDWSLDANGTRVRQIAFYRPSMTVIDYRVEFLAEVENKAVSWVARAANSRFYYLVKLVQVKGGLEPQVNLVRYAVRDGKPDEAIEKPLPFPVRIGQVYRVRMDVIADRFTVTVQDKVVDEWTDAKLLTGGFGVANEAAERGQIRSIQMWHLKPRSK